jgi:hypothetical protein
MKKPNERKAKQKHNNLANLEIGNKSQSKKKEREKLCLHKLERKSHKYSMLYEHTFSTQE